MTARGYGFRARRFAPPRNDDAERGTSLPFELCGLRETYDPAFSAFSISGFSTASMFCAVIGPTSL
jgi:hypothetical protein